MDQSNQTSTKSKKIILDFNDVIDQNNILSTNFGYPETELFKILK